MEPAITATPYFHKTWKKCAWYVIEKVRFMIGEYRAMWRQRRGR